MAKSNAAVKDEFADLDALIDSSQEEVAPEQEETVVSSVDELEDIEQELQEDDDAPVVEPVKVTNTKKDGGKKKASAPRVSVNTQDLKALGESLFDDTNMLLLTTDDDTTVKQTQENVARFDEVQPVKVREKLANVMMWVAGKKKLSRYTEETLKLLAKNKTLSKADIRNGLLDCGVAIGTASSQAGQMSHILVATKVATESAGKFELNTGSVIMALLDGPDDTDSEEA